ncbi:MAG TPA: TIGR01777 family oxidoreductase, partial [Myxococcaceae bacterium]|nr:TIGR01777 family oxidoreductase [Myxococcaceae bacterium]
LEGKTVRALLSASAVGYYGPQGARPLGEEDPPGDDFLARVCLAWEQATAPAAAGGIRTVLLRTGVVLHPEGGALKQMLRPFRLGMGGRLGTGTQYMSWIHREDWLSLCAHCLHAASLSGPVNLTAPNPVTNRELTSALGAALHRPAILPAPAFALKLALGEMSTMLLEGQRVMPNRALEMGFPFKFERIDDALSALFSRQAA